jgi:hypothetical protein
LNKETKIVVITLSIAAFAFVVLPILFGYKIAYYKEVEFDNELINSMIQAFGVILSAYLTYRIIKQTNNIAKMQMDMETNSITMQENLQRRQIKIDLFDRRFAIFQDMLKIFSHIDLLKNTDNKDSLLLTKVTLLIKLHDEIKSFDEVKLDVYSLYKSEFLFNGYLLDVFKQLIKLYTEITVKMNILKASMEYGFIDNLENHYKSIIEDCIAILSYRSIIDEQSKIELNIAEFEK